jgi:ATPase family associated with various cellular activities (AAA)
MTTATQERTQTWHDANQGHLVKALARIKDRLRRHAADPDPSAARLEPSVEASPPDGRPPALEALCAAFGLSPFERDILVLCAGVELDASFGPLCAEAQGNASRPYPTFSLALAALEEAHWSALSPDRPLRRWRLIEVGSGSGLTSAPLRIDERVLHELAGVPHLDEQLATLVEPVGPETIAGLAASHAELAGRVAGLWAEGPRPRRAPIVQLCGPEPAERRAVAATAAARLGLRLAVLAADLIPAGAAELDTLVRLCEREAVLGAILLLVECDEPRSGSSDSSADSMRLRNVGRLVDRIGPPVMVSDRERRLVLQRPCVTIDVARPTRAEQRAAWEAVLGPAVSDVAEALTAQFRLPLPAIRSAAAEAAVHLGNPGNGVVGHAAWDSCRAQSRHRLDDLAQRIEPGATWDDLVLPAAQSEAIRRIALHLRHRALVHDAWGFAAKSSRGLGLTALFAGASGTGKTLAAEVLAAELRLDLYRIDLSSVMSKYIGETEKNLRRVFDAADDGGAILLFDEADALFGKRSEVKDSHDRYANIEVSYLLQRMEAYRGLAILTSNLKNSLDTAFLRRIRFVITFPFPDPPQRAEIWRRVFPASTPTEGLDPGKLAKLNVPGGNIRNIALNAAFLAAHDREPVRMWHVCEAARIEYAKLERPLTDTEIGGWV